MEEARHERTISPSRILRYLSRTMGPDRLAGRNKDCHRPNFPSQGCFCGGVSGRVSFDPDAPQESTVKLEIKTDTLNTGVAQLNNEIKGPTFLDVEKFPLITFKNTSAQRVNDQQYALTGNLTFHGVTKPLTLRSNQVGQSKDSKGESHTGSDIYLVIKRSEFGIKGDSPAVGDDIFLTIRVRN